ncbi:hypothetical protein [Arthrobacter mobilis]|uniref:HTH iclR-type domain-containing protein n=1 Tax=Arthrobacter mobilis TaxID=2724944 RepID=A0A7X6HH40_9MICC|nr:hypothetical protein [Arthrobacter mobilis]NKX56265.1 hypothetical protein [Arthrobacter mobilis]
MDENVRKIAEALVEAVTGLSPVSRTNWRKLSRDIGTPRQAVFDALEALTAAGYISGWVNGAGYRLALPESGG